MYRIVAFFFLFFTVGVSAQESLDSLRSIYNNRQNHDTTRLRAVAILIDNLYDHNGFVQYNNLMGQLAQKKLTHKGLSAELRKKYTMYLAAYYNNVGAQLNNTDGDRRSLEYAEKAMQLYYSVGAFDEYYLGIVSKGFLLASQKRYREAIGCYFKALKYFERDPVGNADGISYVYSNLGVLYSDQEQYEQSIVYLKKAIVYLDNSGVDRQGEDDTQKFTLYYNIGSSYINLRKYPEAITNLNRALQWAKKGEQSSYISFALGKLGMIDLKQGRYNDAEKKLLEAKQLSETGLSQAFALVYLGNVYFIKKQYEKAKPLLEEGLAQSKTIANTDLQEQAYQLLYKIYKLRGDFRESVEMLEMFQKLKDSTKIAENRNELAKQQMQYDFEKKELNYKLIAEKESAAKNIWLTILMSALILLVLLAWFLYRLYRQKQRLAAFEKNDLSQKLLLSQMNPHFIFNSIDNIQSLIYVKRDAEALEYLSKFSKLTRQILENSSENYISLSEELQMIDNYLGIQQLLYDNRFDFSIEIDESIETDAVLLPPMLTQPFIENAIKHGLRGKNDAGKIDIRFYMLGQKLMFEIIDNGVGFVEGMKSGANKSLAMKITRQRLKHISKRDLELHQQNRTDAENKIIGAKVFFEIPYLYEN